MMPTAIEDLSDYQLAFNREKYKLELADGIYQLMRLHGVNRVKLAELLGVTKARVSHMLSGSMNLQAESIADVLLVLERTPHLVLGTDFDEIRFPVDEGVSESLTVSTGGAWNDSETEQDKICIQGSYSFNIGNSVEDYRRGGTASTRDDADWTATRASDQLVRFYANDSPVKC